MIKLLWASQLRGEGNTFGYSSMANNMKAELLKRSDVEIIEDLEQEYDIACHFTTPDAYKPITYAKNCLVTMYEATSLPDQWVKPINYAEILIVPCKQNVDVFSRYYKRGKVEKCRLGIDPVLYPFHQRTAPDPNEPFRVLWIGAPNPRKGYQLAFNAWSTWLRTNRMPRNMQLWMKSSGTDKDRLVKFRAANQYRGPNAEKIDLAKVPIEKRLEYLRQGYILYDFFEEQHCNPESPELPGIVVDTFTYTPEKMREIYNSAHAFILPSVGEGWGLTLCEAMATGCPSVWTHWSGMREFADESTGFPITKFSMVSLEMLGQKKDEARGTISIVKVHDSYGALPDTGQIIQRLEQIYADYPAALARGKKASERIHAKFKWSDCVAEFVEICTKYV